MENKAVRQYLRQVKRALPWGPVRTQLMERANAMLTGYIQEDPEAQYDTLTSAFGPAQGFAQEMLSTLEPQAVARARARQRRLCRGGVAAVILALIALAAACFVRWRELREIIPENSGFAIIEPVQTVTPDEFEEFFQSSDATSFETQEAYIEGHNIIGERN